MKVEKYTLQEFPEVHPFTGVNSISKSLLENKFLVVRDEKLTYFGILLPSDIVVRPHKLVVDCLSETHRVDADDDLPSVYNFMIDKRAYVLPVFKNGVFIGILSVDQIAGTMNKFTERLSARLIRNEHQLKVTKEKAVIAENLKTAILENISHEIRTPMNGLLGFSYLLASEGITDEKRLSYIEHIEESCKKLTNVIDNIIEISCIQAGDNHIVDHEECTAGDILRELHIYYDHEKKKLDKNQIEFICKYPIENNSSIKCDPKRLKEILSYLIDNAFKFTEKGFVEIGAHIKNTLVFYVKDTGIGISAENQNAIFNAFSKIVEEKGPILYPGLGLGLTIAKRLIELMGGSITVESEYTKGSVFYVTMPLLENSV